MDENDIDFAKHTLNERISIVNERIGEHPDRIESPYQLLDLYGQTIYLVVSPFGKETEIGNCIILTWDVGKIFEHRGIEVTKDYVLTFDKDEKYLCFDVEQIEKGISLKDFNIVPNSYNNHAAFSNLESAEAYIMYRKLQYLEDPTISDLGAGDYAHWFKKEDVQRLINTEDQAAAQ